MRQDRDRRFIDHLPVLATVLGCLVALLAVGAIATLAWSKGLSPFPRERVTDYFPPRSVDEFEAQWYGTHLNAMHEPALGAPRAQAAKGVSELRVLVLPTWGHPAAVRYTFDTSGTTRRAIKLCGAGGYEPGRIGIDRTTQLTATETSALLASLDASGYWSMPQEEDILGTDGTQVIVESVRDGNHRVRVRWTPDSDSAKRGLEAFVAFYTDALQRGGVATAQQQRDPVCR